MKHLHKCYILYFIFFFTPCLILFEACAPSRLVRPLEKGQKAISADLGGPVIQFKNALIPIPLTTLMYGQGISDKTSVFGSLHTTSLLFGVLQTDIGACQRIYYNDSLRLGISFNPALNIAQEFWPQWSGGFKCWPQLDLNIYWEVKAKKSFFYLGVENWFEFASTRAEDQAQTTHWIFCPQAGYTWARPKWNFNVELKDIGPNINNLPNVAS